MSTRLARYLWMAALSLCAAGCGDSEESAPASTREAVRESAPAAAVVAVVRSTGWMETMAREAGGEIFIHHEPLAADLVVVYARDSGGSVDYLTREQAAAFEADDEPRRRRAVETLAARMPDLARDEVAPGVFALQGDPNYTPSVLLMDEVWRAQAGAVKGDLIAVVPTRGAILFTGSKNAGAVKRMRDVAAKAAAGARYPISEVLLRRYGGEWIPFD